LLETSYGAKLPSPALAGIHACGVMKFRDKAALDAYFSAPGTPNISRLAYAAAEVGRRTRITKYRFARAAIN